jgi:hypothetical protein
MLSNSDGLVYVRTYVFHFQGSDDVRRPNAAGPGGGPGDADVPRGSAGPQRRLAAGVHVGKPAV